MVKAGSIAYAIFICIIIGVFCYSLLLMSGYSKVHQTMLFTYSELLSNNESAQNYFLAKTENVKEGKITIDLFENGIISSGSIKPWGFYQTLLTTSIFKKDTIISANLIGQKRSKDNLALYLIDMSKSLFMVGKAKITGNAFLPKKGIKQGYLTSNAYQNTKHLTGNKSVSKSTLPKITDLDFAYDDQKSKLIDILEINDSIPLHNYFTNATLIITTNNAQLKGRNFSGNIVLKSNDSIYIKQDNILKDIIIDAPKVVFEKGFQGSVQVLAQTSVTLEENVILKYPSGIMINEKDTDVTKEIVLNTGSKVIGGVVMNNLSRKSMMDQMITIESEAEVIGDIYCSGSLQLKGNVIGTVYTSNFYLKTEASSYDNYIMDGTIDRKSLPENFIRIPLFEKKSEQFGSYAIIKSI